MRNFAESCYRSILDPAWLKAHRASGGKAWGFFFIVSILIVLVFAVPTAMTVLSAWGQVQKTFIAKAPDFKAQLKSGTLTVSGITQPYRFFEKDFGFAIDTAVTTTLTAGQLMNKENWPAGFLVTRQQVEVFNQANDQDEVRSLKELPDFVLSKKDIVQAVDGFNNSTRLKLVLAGILLVIGYITFVVSRLFDLAMIALLVWVFAKITKRAYSFGEVFTMGLYVVTVPALMSGLFLFLPIEIPQLFSFTWLAFLSAVVLTKDVGEGEKKIV
jgi:Protein of unknown function (DUF1189)